MSTAEAADPAAAAADLVARAAAWRDEDPDPVTAAEVTDLLDGAAGPDLDALAARFNTRLEFGTAGLRGALGAGPARMNRALVRRATAGVARWVLDGRSTTATATAARAAPGGPVVVGHDARHGSAAFAEDAARVLAGAGLEVALFDRLVPTPVLAFAVTHLGASAGIMVTASHNPPADNGYKVYAGDGAQIVPPMDGAISAAINAVGPLSRVALADGDDPRIRRVGAEVVDAYVSGVAQLATSPEHRDLRIAYTPLHGVGRDVLLAVFAAAGFPAPVVVAEQAAPDPDFPTVAFPNPEEPGAMDALLALAAETGADLALANDPDADRLAVAFPTAGGGWRALTGDEIGVALGDWLLSRGAGADRLVATSIVSSSLLGRVADTAGVAFAETLTGFKWLARAALARPDLRFVYGYEEALGSCVGELVRDKDGISAALAFAELAATEGAAGRTVLDRLDDLARAHGVHATRQRSVHLDGPDGPARARAVVGRLVADPPASVGGLDVVGVDDLRAGGPLPPSDVVRLRLAGGRVLVRPSGTEPKLKAYVEVVVPVTGADVATARVAAEAAIDAVLTDLDPRLS
ncbi:MAG: phospho-sugar mutase [Acidimicrobiales bacterium]